LAQALSDIIQSLDAGYAPSRQLIQSQVDALPQQEQAQQQGLQAQANQSYNDITNAARDKGMGFSGIPIAEQAKYNATTFLPAVANLQSSMNNQKTSLLGALNTSNQDELKTAMGIQQNQQQIDATNAARAAATRASAASSGGSLASLFGGGAAQQQAAAKPAMTPKQNGQGFNFTDPNGSAISAASYAKLTNQPIGAVLRTMGQAGDKYAQQAYNEIAQNSHRYSGENSRWRYN
jgi:hypothetical protein